MTGRFVNGSERRVPQQRRHPNGNRRSTLAYDAFFGADFMPLIRHEQTQGAQEHLAYAAEFAAFQLGQIDIDGIGG